jgi:acid stress-induced BolA-like protein IbaG/YrbA
MKTLCSHPNAVFWGTKVAKRPFYSIGTKIMFGSVSEHFANLRHVKRCKTCVSSLNALFRGTKVVNRPFYSIRIKMMFGGVLEHFANLQHVKRCKTCVRAECTASVYQSCEASILLHWNENDVWCNVSEHFANLRHVKRCKTCVRTRMHYFRVPKL